MSDPQRPSRRELRQRMWSLDTETRRRISGAVRRGERLASPEEAALGVAVARSSLKTITVLVALLAVLTALKVVQIAAAVSAGRDVLLDVAVLAVAVGAAVKFLAFDRPRLLRAERLNRSPGSDS